MPSLLMLSPAPVRETPAGEIVLDVRFVEGMKLHCQLWPGRVRCILWRGATHIAEPMRYAINHLDFELVLLEPGQSVPDMMLEASAMVYCAADDMRHLDLPAKMQGRMGKVVYTVGQNLWGRIGTALNKHNSLRRRFGSTFWSLRKERQFRDALRQADGIHCDGYPAFQSYRRVNGRALRYLDNRIRAPMLLRGSEAEASAERLQAGAPLRLAWFGTMDDHSGVEALLPMAFLLKSKGMRFHLDVAGEGPQFERLREGRQSLGLADEMTLHGFRRFESQLVPSLRKEADLLVSTRRDSTPTGTYVEALGSGLPIVGFKTAMLNGIARDSGACFLVRSGSNSALVKQIEFLDRNRNLLVSASQNGVRFARSNSFEQVFARRMADLRDIAGLD